MIHVRKNIERVPAEIVEAFKGQAAATIHEAQGKKGYIDCKIKPIKKGLKICGPAFTVTCPPGDNMMIHKALERAQPGDVIVANCGGEPGYEWGYFGDLMCTSAIARQLGGLAIDGCVRDSAEMAESGFPIFARGFCIRGTGKGQLGIINYPMVFGGIMVEPGDLIVGDDDGLVLVKKADAEETLKKTLARVEAEIVKAETLATGVSSVEYNKFGPMFEKAGLVEEE